MIIKPGPVIEFLIANQNVRNPGEIDWGKAKRTLKNLRVKTRPSNMEFKIVGLSELPCNQQMFTLKQKNGRGDSPSQTVEITVYDYFVNYRHIELRFSESLPCINVGKPKRPTYYPIELCSLVSLQRYTKSLSTLQRSALVEKSRQKPQERMQTLSDVGYLFTRCFDVNVAHYLRGSETKMLILDTGKALRSSNYGADEMLKACGVSINGNFTQVEGRVLNAPKLKVGNDEFFPRNGRWNFNNKKLVDPQKIERWAIVNFSARCDVRSLARDLHKCGAMKGIVIAEPFEYFEENPQFRRAPPTVRVDKMFEIIQSKLPGAPQFLLCILPERKNCDIYGPWKKKSLSDFGIVTQCIAPQRVNDQYLTNVLLKINAKVVSSMQWPKLSHYRASVRTQSPKVEMIDSLFKPVSDKEDKGIIQELLVEFYKSSGKRKPDQIIIFRDGVSESQFTQVLNIELDQIIQACKFLDDSWSPRFTVIVAQKNHHTKFFQLNSPDNVPPVAPISYAHLAATQMSQFIKFEESSETSSSHGGITSAGAVPVPELPRLHQNVSSSMFFC
ncbi:hypothetical protein ACLOJK_000113 [Asimina triloba]